MPHRWSPLSTGAIKSYNNGKKIKKKIRITKLKII